MQENGTVQQLSKALNQLLDAYEKLQGEAHLLREENIQIKDEIADLELRNRGLDSRLSTLNDTTQHNSSEMDTMLGRIENILGPTLPDIAEVNAEVEEKIESAMEKEKVEPVVEQTEEIEHVIEEEKVEKEDSNREIDLGRMQSLLNGFSN
jgi:methyl-accepting chemotaxis protein